MSSTPTATAAQVVKEHFPATALLRRHPHPIPEKFAPLHERLAKHGLGLDLRSPVGLANSLDACEKVSGEA